MTDTTKYKSVCVKHTTDNQLKDLSAVSEIPVSKSAMISHLENPKLYATFTSGPDGSFSCQGDSWDEEAKGVHFMQVCIAGYGAQWIQRWFNGEDVQKHFRING